MTELRTKRGLRRRLLRHYLPLALGSAVALVLFMTVPRLDASEYSQGDIFSGTFPKDFPAVQRGAMQHRGAQPPQQQGGGHQIPKEKLEQIPEQHRSQSPGLSPTPQDVDDRSFWRRLTTATGYAALALLGLTL